MKKKLITLLALAACGLSAIGHAASIPSSGTVNIQNTSYDGGTGHFNIGGGEFEANVDGNVFYTFCVEIEQSIIPFGDFDYDLSSSVDSQAPLDLISRGTAYLFELFVNGNLYARTLDAAHDEAAGYLQAAIWILEDEDPVGHVHGSAISKFFNINTNPYIAKVVSVYGDLATAKLDDDKGTVKVMNLSRGDEKFQDVLVYVPDSGSTLALLGFGFATIAMIRRRSKK